VNFNTVLISAIFLFSSVQIVFGQEENTIVVQSDDSTRFILMHNGARVSDTSWYSYKIDGITDKQNLLQVVVDSSGFETKKSIYFENRNVEASVKLVNYKDVYKLRFEGEGPIGSSENRVDQVNVNLNMPITPLEIELNDHAEMDMSSELTNTTGATNASVIDSEEMVVSIDSSNIEIDSLVMDSVDRALKYQGATGCIKAENEIEQLLKKVSSVPFNSKKMNLLSDALEGGCFWVKDVELLLNQLPYEDDRLGLIRKYHQNFYDQDNVTNLRSLFSLNATKEKFDQVISS